MIQLLKTISIIFIVLLPQIVLAIILATWYLNPPKG